MTWEEDLEGIANRISTLLDEGFTEADIEELASDLEGAISDLEGEIDWLHERLAELEEARSILEEILGEEELSEEDFKLPLEGTDFNLTEFLRQVVTLSLPEKPLCREDCKGLCPICGANLNYGECEHVARGEVSLADPRWRELDVLLEGGEPGGSPEEADVKDEEEEEENPLRG